MKKAVSVFLRDLRRILHNPVALLVVLGIATVPCLYAWINVLANWDPYANTSGMTVAVVTEDQPVLMEGQGNICVGDMMVDALKENDKISWDFMDDKEDAIAAVRSGKYYAALVIPQDFTKSLTSILDGNTDKAHLHYYVNEKVNPIAPKVTDTVAATVQNQVDSQFSAKVGEVIAEKLEGISDKLITKSEGAVDEGISVLDSVNVTLLNVDSQLGDLSGSLQSAQIALANAADNAASLEGIGSRISSKLSNVLDDFSTTRSNASSLIADINKALGNSASTISKLSSQANYDVSAISGDIASALAEVNAAIRALEKDLTDNEALVTKIEDARSAVASITLNDTDAELVRIEISDKLDTEYDLMIQLTEEQKAKLDELRAIAAKLETAAETVSGLSDSINSKVQTATDALSNAQTGIISQSLVDIQTALDSFVATANELQAAAEQVDPIITQIVSLTRQFSNVLGETNGALAGTRSSLSELRSHLNSLTEELAAVRSSKTWALLRDLTKTDPDSVHEFLSAPVEINEVDLFPVENYASGVAPFFTSLALWVGGIALVAIFKLEVDEDEVGKLRPWQAYFGRLMLFVLIGALQAIVCCTGDLIIGIQCAYPWAFYLSAIVASFAFVNIIYGLSVAFKHLGKALAFTLVILQVPGSAGMYPIEMMPKFFQAINPWLPFTYSINAMREAVAGFYGTNLVRDLATLLLLAAPAVLLGVTMRKRLININALFDERLRETDHLLVSEPIAVENHHYRLSSVVKAYHSPDEYRETFNERSAAFEKAYPSLIRGGVIALFLLPLFMFVLMLVLDSKLPTIAGLVISLVGIYSFLILVEFFHNRVQHKQALTEMSQEELDAVLLDTLRDEVMPMAPIDAIIEKRKARAAKKEEAAEDKDKGLVGMLHYPTRHMGKGQAQQGETTEGGDEQ